MGTRAAAFAGKISNLRESILRLQNGNMPQPTCIDLANMLKYFSQVLHDFRDFKDIENVPLYAREKRDRMQLIKTLPNFDYCGLYRTLSQLVDILPLIPASSNGLDLLGGNLLMLIKCLVPFLDQANMETMPYLTSTLFMSLPVVLHKDILDTLCFNLLPFTIDQQKNNPGGVANQRLVKSGARYGSRSSFNRASSRRTSKRGSRRSQQKPVHCIVRIENPSEASIQGAQDVAEKPKKKEGGGGGGSDSIAEDQGIESDCEQGDILPDDDDDLEADDEYALLSVTSILMITFHYVTEPMHHSQLVECLMKLKSNVFEDLLYVIAYGTTRARCPAVEILFRYWPDICPSQQDRKNNSQASKLKHIPWQPTKCQNKNCKSFTTLGDDGAVKMCLDFKISITLSDAPPPMLVCLYCYEQREQMTAGYLGEEPIQAIDDSKFIDLLLPMERVSKLCENKECKSVGQDKTAIGTCFDVGCANYNRKKPIRYCKNCFILIHKPSKTNIYDTTLQNHIRHSSLNLNIMDDEDSVNNFIEAIISLLKEAAPADRPSKDSERYLRSLMGPMSQFNTDNKDMSLATEEKQLISQYGIWLMTGLCKEVGKISDDLLGRLLGMLFQWFHFTACLPDDQAGSALEKLKGECIKGWIMDVKTQRNELFVSCLLPHPIDCSKIGGHWEVWPDTAHQIKEGFKRLLCLVPYDIITNDVWDDIMPFWMECFRHEVPENELSELKILLSKVFDPELSPLGFETKQMYNFISSRFENTNNTNQEQTLYWLQIITMLEIPIPIDFLFQMLKSGVRSLASMRANELNKLRIARRLASLDKLPPAASDRSSMTTSRSASGLTADHSESSTTASTPTSIVSPASRAMSLQEDDVLLPSASSARPEPARAPQVPMSQKERQARARADFSASVMQYVSELDGKPQQSSSSPSVSPSAFAPVQQAPAPAATGSSRLATIVSSTSVGKSLGLGPSQGLHNRPLKSTTSDGEPLGRHARASSSSSQTGAKPKLKLQMQSGSGSGSGSEDGVVNKVDNNLICYILMMDILLKQLDLQEIAAHRGLDGREAQQAIELLNAIIATPWIGQHTCCDSLPQSSPSSSGQQQAAAAAAATSVNSPPPVPAANEPKADPKKPADGPAPATDHNVHSFGHCAQGFEREDSYETCVFCEIISTFHQLSMFLIEFFAPVIEVSICEVSQEAANGEFDGRPDYSRIGALDLGLPVVPPSSTAKPTGPTEGTSGAGQKFNFNGQAPGRGPSDQEPASPFSPTNYSGPSLRPEVVQTLPKELQLAYNLLVQFHQYQTPDIVSQLLQMIKLISLHSQVLSKAAKTQPPFISWCQHNMLIGKLWSLCQLESSEIARTCVPLLLHCVTLPWGVRLFRDLVEKDFSSDSWLSRFRAVERVVTIAYFCEPSTIKNSTLLQSTMASAFCYVVRCLDDIEAIVAQRALVSLEMMKTSSLKLLLWCLEVQFDYIIIDRPMILRSVFQLYNHLRDRRFLTWEFFLNRFDTIFLEAQIYLQQTGEIPSFTMQDLKNTNTKSELYQKKISRAKEALQETHHSRSLSKRFQEKQFSSTSSTRPDDLSQQYKQSLKLQRQMDSSEAAGKLPEVGKGSMAKRGQQSPSKRVMQHGKSTSSRYQSIAFLTSQSMVKRTNSKFMANLAMQSVPPLMLPDKLHQHLPNSFVDDGSKLNEIAQENHVFGVVHRVCDEDRDTNHSLIFLLMQFLSKPDPSHPQSVKTLNRSHQIVLRHLNILMGYSVARKNFLIAATNLRLLPVFNAFLTSLPKVLDFNYSLGTILLDTCLPVLIYCPAPDNIQFDAIKTPSYSLWLLNPLMRQSWLMSIMAFLYKYQFGQAHLKEQVHMLMWIVINTLESHLNCSTLEVALDRCNLINVRDSQATVGSANMADEPQHGRPTTATPQEGSKQATGSQQGGESPARAHKPPEVIELRPAKMDGADKKSLAMAASTSQGSLRPSLTANQEQTSFSSSSAANATSPSKSLMKAETSDSLNVKAKQLFQRKQTDVGTSGRASSSGERAARTSSPVGSSRVATEGADQGARASGRPAEVVASPPPPPAGTGDERLLPIGLPAKSHRAGAEMPAAERLLPIGASHPRSHPELQGLRRGKESAAVGKTAQDESAKAKTLPAEKSSSGAAPSNQAAQATSPGQGRPEPQKVPATQPSARILEKLGATGELASQELTTTTTTTGKEKNNRRRFGGGKQSETGKQSALTGKANTLDAIEPSTSGGKFAGGRKLGKAGKLGGKGGGLGAGGSSGLGEYQPAKQVNTGLQPSFSSPSLLNEQLALINRHSLVQEFSDKDLSMCLVILETFIHHEPSMAAQMLPNILRLVARYSSANLDAWQAGSNVHLVGGSMFVARQFIRVALHDLMENNIFHQIFTSHFTGYEFYKSMATALADFTDLNQLAPLSKLFEDLNRQKNLPQATSLMTILENVATYFECILGESTSGGATSHSQATWSNFILNWENFLRKLILALPRYSGSTIAGATGATGSSSGGRAELASPSAGQSIGASGPAGGSGPLPVGQPAGGSGGGGGGGGGDRSAGGGPKFGGGPENAANVASAQAIPSSCSMIMAPIMRIILSTTKISHLASCKTIVDPYSKIISYTVLNSQFKYEHLLEINHNCCRLYTRDREKYLIQRTIAYELVQVLKFRFFILEDNLLILLLFILQDVGGTLAPHVIRDSLKIDQATLNQADSYITNVSECLRQNIGDLLEFITDVHAISRINDNLIGAQPSSINRDSFGGHVKAAISQYLALEMCGAGGAGSATDNRTVHRYLPWLFTSPSLQQGPREFIDCVSHIRQLSWIILGSLQHSSLVRAHYAAGAHSLGPSLLAGQGGQGSLSPLASCQPIPIDKNGSVAEYVQVILAGFAEQSKESVLHMSGLFHAFLLCQLWTMYCENIAIQHPPNSDLYQYSQSTLDDFWAKITPGVLRLVGHSRVMSEMVSTHFLQLIESLIESNSSILIRYLPMWNSVFYSYRKRNKSSNLAIRLQKCIEWQPPDLNEQDVDQNNKRLVNWLEKVQYKMSHIEIQSSQAAPFYLT